MCEIRDRALLHIRKLSRLKSHEGGIKKIFLLEFAHEYVKMWGASESWQSNTKVERAGIYVCEKKKGWKRLFSMCTPSMSTQETDTRVHART